MPKTKEKSDAEISAKKPPIILLNRTRARIMVPKPRVAKGGNPQKFACDIVTIHAGLNRPIPQDVWELIVNNRHRHKLDGDEPELRRLDSVSEIPEMAIDQVLQNCGDPPSVKWWLSVEKRPKVRKKIDAWLEKIAEKAAKRRGRSSAA